MAVGESLDAPRRRGMTLGSVDREWAEHHHPRWVEELDAQTAPPRARAVTPERQRT
jgi:cytochrome b subunit of formate dehydrogenase